MIELLDTFGARFARRFRVLRASPGFRSVHGEAEQRKLMAMANGLHVRAETRPKTVAETAELSPAQRVIRHRQPAEQVETGRWLVYLTDGNGPLAAVDTVLEAEQLTETLRAYTWRLATMTEPK